MRITDPTPLLSPEGRVYVSGSRFSVFVFRLAALVAAILLPTQAIPSNATTSRGFATTDLSAGSGGDHDALPRDYKCTSKDVKESETGQGGLREAVREAIEILERCPACRQFFRGKDPRAKDPVEYIKELDRSGKILLTEGIPEGFRRDKNLYVPRGYEGFTPKQFGLFVEPRLPGMSGPPRRPCIYLNASSFAGKDKAPLLPPYDGLTRPRARGILLLHEFGHATAAIPRDGGDITGWKSSQNTHCVRAVCEPCAAKVTECVHRRNPDSVTRQSKEKPKSPVRRR
jgi:hypothetical protein